MDSTITVVTSRHHWRQTVACASEQTVAVTVTEGDTEADVEYDALNVAVALGDVVVEVVADGLVVAEGDADTVAVVVADVVAEVVADTVGDVVADADALVVVVNVGVMMRLFHCFHVIGEVYVDAVVAVIVNDGAALADVIDRWVEEVV